MGTPVSAGFSPNKLAEEQRSSDINASTLPPQKEGGSLLATVWSSPAQGLREAPSWRKPHGGQRDGCVVTHVSLSL